jgi:hypothetical protein
VSGCQLRRDKKKPPLRAHSEQKHNRRAPQPLPAANKSHINSHMPKRCRTSITKLREQLEESVKGVVQLRRGLCQRNRNARIIQHVAETCAGGLVDHKQICNRVPRVGVSVQRGLVSVHAVRPQLPKQSKSPGAAGATLQPKHQRVVARRAPRFHEPEEQLGR